MRARVEQVRAALLAEHSCCLKPHHIAISVLAPSSIAASDDLALPDRCASSIAQTIPKAHSSPPPPNRR